MPTQRAVLLRAKDTAVGDAQQVDVPAYTGETTIYADFISPTLPETDLAATLIPLSEHTHSEIYIIHAPSSSSKSSRMNTLVNTVLTAPLETNEPVRGNAILMYGEAGKDMLLDPDWRCLYDVCYESQLASLGGNKQSTLSAKALAEDFVSRLSAASASTREAVVEQEEDEDDGTWTDEDVEPSDRPKRESESDSDKDAGDAEEEEEEEEEDEEEEEESELDSDDEDDPKKKALLDAIRNMILTDGKLDLDRLGLVEKNGQLVPKDDA